MTPYRRLIRRSIASGMAALAAAAVLSGTASLAAAAGLAASATVSVRPPTLAADGHDCGSGEWHFILNQINPPAAPPASITVYWANGSNQTVPRDTTPGSTKVAHYRTTSHLDSSVVNATAVIDTAWKGKFNLSHGPDACSSGGGSGITPPPDPAETPELGSLALFGSGAAGLAGYALTRLRAARRRD